MIRQDDDQTMALDLNKINVAGSQIYGTKGDGSPVCIERPSVLFDDLYSSWFLDFVQGIVNDFVEVSREERTAIIMDNSPGYVGAHFECPPKQL